MYASKSSKHLHFASNIYAYIPFPTFQIEMIEIQSFQIGVGDGVKLIWKRRCQMTFLYMRS